MSAQAAPPGAELAVRAAMAPDELVARARAWDVLTRYCRALDRCDVELMRAVYWPDGHDDHGVFSGNAHDFAEFIIREIRRWFEVTMHAIMNVHYEVAGDVVCTETYLFAYHKVRANAADIEEIFGSRYAAQFDWASARIVPQHFYFGGRYIDRIERRGDEWRIARRTVVMDWNDNGPSGEILDQGMFATLRPLGRRDREDPAYLNRP
ncbi:MAG: nuclear transport factor 2 family protein [Sphingomonadaceae bacterium]